MHTLLQILGLMPAGVAREARRTNNLLRQVAIILLLWPIVPLVGAVTWGPRGMSVTAFVSLIFPITALLIILLRWPLLTVAVGSIHGLPRKALGAVFAGIAYELIAGVYLTLVPVGNARGLIPVFVLVVTTWVILTLANGFGIKVPLTGIMRLALVILAIWLTAAFFNGGIDGLNAWFGKQQQSSQAYTGQTTSSYVQPSKDGLYEIELKGAGIKSDPFSLALVPSGKYVSWVGPPGTEVCWEYMNQCWPITATWSDPIVDVARFIGPAGGIVSIRVYAP